MLPEAPENFRNNLAMCPEVRVGDEDIVQVDHNVPRENEILKDVIHHGLKRRRRIGESEIHHQRLEEPPVGPERRLPLVAFLDADIIETPPNIEFGKKAGSL